MLLESKVTLTSGAGGVGGAVAKAFARGDASVFLANCALSRPEPITTETKAKDGKAEVAKVGDAFLYRYDDAHRCKMKLVELLPTRKLSGWSQRVTSTSQRTRTSGGGAKLILSSPRGTGGRQYGSRTRGRCLPTSAMNSARGYGEITSVTACVSKSSRVRATQTRSG